MPHLHSHLLVWTRRLISVVVCGGRWCCLALVLRGQGFLREAVGLFYQMLRSGDALLRGKDSSCPQLLSSDHPEPAGSDTQLLREFASDRQLSLARVSRWSVCPLAAHLHFTAAEFSRSFPRSHE